MVAAVMVDMWSAVKVWWIQYFYSGLLWVIITFKYHHLLLPSVKGERVKVPKVEKSTFFDAFPMSNLRTPRPSLHCSALC